MRGHLAGRYIPGDSRLHRLDERAKLFGFLILTAAVILTDTVAGYILMAGVIFVVWMMSGLSAGDMFGATRRLIPFFIIVFLMNALFYNTEDVIWHKWIFTLSQAGMIQGANVVLRIALIIFMSSALTMTTSSMGLMTAIEALVKPLSLVRLPAEEIAMILSVALQFIPTLLEESDTVRKAQIARGARFESRKLHERAAALVPMIVPIFLSAFRRADELSVAMEARGYRGARYRTKKKTKGMDGKAWAALLICGIICYLEVLI